MRLVKEKVDALCDKYGFHMHYDDHFKVHMCDFRGQGLWEPGQLNEMCAWRCETDPGTEGLIIFGIDEKYSLKYNQIATCYAGYWPRTYEEIEYRLKQECDKLKRLKKIIRRNKIKEL